MAQVIEKIVRSKYPPRDTRVIWLDENDGIMKHYLSGQWIAKNEDFIKPKNPEFKPRPDISNAIKITYKELIKGNLKPNALYRLIDYEPVYKEGNGVLSKAFFYQPFDLILQTDNTGYLYTECWAANKSEDIQVTVVVFEDKPCIGYILGNDGKTLNSNGDLITIDSIDVLKEGNIINGRKIISVYKGKTSDLIHSNNYTVLFNTHDKDTYNNLDCEKLTAIDFFYSGSDYNTCYNQGKKCLKQGNNIIIIKYDGTISKSSIRQYRKRYYSEDSISKWNLLYQVNDNNDSYPWYDNYVENHGILHKWSRHDESDDTTYSVLTTTKNLQQASCENPIMMDGYMSTDADNNILFSYTTKNNSAIVLYDEEHDTIYCTEINDSKYAQEPDLLQPYVYEGAVEIKGNTKPRGLITKLIDENNIKCNFDFKSSYIVLNDKNQFIVSENWSILDGSVFYDPLFEKSYNVESNLVFQKKEDDSYSYNVNTFYKTYNSEFNSYLQVVIGDTYINDSDIEFIAGVSSFASCNNIKSKFSKVSSQGFKKNSCILGSEVYGNTTGGSETIIINSKINNRVTSWYVIDNSYIKDSNIKIIGNGFLRDAKIYNSNTTLKTSNNSGNIISDNFNYNGEVEIFNYKEPTYLIYNTKANAVEIGSISNILTRVFMDYGN